MVQPRAFTHFWHNRCRIKHPGRAPGPARRAVAGC